MSHENHEDRIGRFIGDCDARYPNAHVHPEAGVMCFGNPLVDVSEVEPLVFIDPDNKRTDVALQAASSLLDHGRFHFRVDFVLSRYDESECGKPRYPDSDELIEAGVDVVSLAQAVQWGLTPATLGKAYHAGLDLRAFAAAVDQGLNVKAFVTAFKGGALSVADFADTLGSMSISGVNDCLEMIAETVEEHAEFPDLTDRVLNRLGEYSVN